MFTPPTTTLQNSFVASAVCIGLKKTLRNTEDKNIEITLLKKKTLRLCHVAYSYTTSGTVCQAMLYLLITFCTFRAKLDSVDFSSFLQCSFYLGLFFTLMCLDLFVGHRPTSVYL